MTTIGGSVWMKPTVRKAGYPGEGSLRSLGGMKYVVYHSLEGWGGNVMNIQNDPNQEKSWPATVLLDGTLWEHYQIEDVCWINGDKVPNTIGYGVEFEGVKGAPITDAQVVTAARIFVRLQSVCSGLGSPVLGQGFEEHRRVSGGATSCPSDRIRWDDIRKEVVKGVTDMAELTGVQATQLEEASRFSKAGFAKTDEIWTSMFGSSRDSVLKQQHRDILALLNRPSGLTLTVADIEAIATRTADMLAARLKA